ncbi:MAG: hypothetical protein JNK45_22055, partial [Myxococcales bacterium]|nr:hypothetical protein [Myxococcales bacterium]
PRIAVAVAGAMIPAGIWMALVRTPEVDPCTRGAEIIAAAWGPTQRGQIAVTETGFAPAFVAGRTERLRTSLDDYAGRWAQLHDEVCTTQRDDDDGDSGGDVRIECLEDRRASFETLTAALATQPIDPPSIDAVLADLPALSACRATGVGAWTPMPEDQGMRASVTELRAELRLLGVKREMGAPGSELRAALDDLLGRAEAVGYPHLVASVEAEFGALELQEGRIERSLALLDAALVRALEHGHGRVAAAAIVTMLMVSKRSPTTPIDAERLGRIAKAVVVAAGGDDGISGKIASAVGALRFEGGDVRGAASAFAEASVALERAFGPQAPQLVRPRLAQSLALLSLGDTDGAERVVATVTPIIDAAFDQGHELVIEAASLRAGISDIQGDWRRALALYLEALHTAQEVHGDRDASISALAYNVAAVAAMHGLVDIARENLTLSRRAWPVRDDPVAEGEFLQVEASIALAAGEWIEAIRLADAGAVELEKAGGARNHRIAAVRLTRATAQLAQRRYDDVLATISAPDWSVGFEPHDRGRLGVIAATALGDPLAAARWLGFAEAGPETALVPSRTLTRLLVFPRPTPEQQASARTARAAVADATFAGDPVLAVFDEWLAGRWPPDASSAFAPLGSVRTHQ